MNDRVRGYTMERTLRLVSVPLMNRQALRTHAHTCVPCSGMMVKHTCSSLSFTQARGPSELSDAVSSIRGQCNRPRAGLRVATYW